MTQQRERLIRAMIDSPDLEGAFRFDAEFKAQVTVIADLLPVVLKVLADEAYIGHQRRTQAYEQLSKAPATTVFFTNEEIESMRAKGIEVQP